jgi:uncharacterized protein YbaA (DUF1428 family)
MMSYIDGFLLAVPTANMDAYRKMAALGAEVFKDHGAIRVVEAWGDDVPEGQVNSFHTAVMRKPDEDVVFSYIEWPDKATRDAGMAASMEDERFESMGPDGMPFDGSRMIFGGFEAIVEA